MSTSCTSVLPEYNQPVMGPAHVLNVVDEAVKSPCAPHRVARYHSERIEEWRVLDEKRFDMNMKEHRGEYSRAHPSSPTAEILRARPRYHQPQGASLLSSSGGVLHFR